MTHDPHVSLPGRTAPHRWEEGWGAVPAIDDSDAWAHPGLAIDLDGSILVADAAEPIVHRLDGATGRLLESLRLPLVDIHGLACESRPEGRVLWVADQGVRLRIDGSETVRTGPGSGRVIRLDAVGDWDEVEAPSHPAYHERPYRPTSIALDPAGDDVWVADGYGAHLVHRYDRAGAYRGSLSVEDRDPFDTPHAVFIDRRGPEPRVLVADRGNRRIRSYDLDGTPMGDLPANGLTSPSGIAALGELTLVAELDGSVAVLDPDGRCIGLVGAGDAPTSREGWPNERREDGTIGRPSLTPGRFNSPHAIDVGRDGSIYVAEFVLGGRLVRITPPVEALRS